jgi:hypothetical protein
VLPTPCRLPRELLERTRALVAGPLERSPARNDHRLLRVEGARLVVDLESALPEGPIEQLDETTGDDEC